MVRCRPALVLFALAVACSEGRSSEAAGLPAAYVLARQSPEVQHAYKRLASMKTCWPSQLSPDAPLSTEVESLFLLWEAEVGSEVFASLAKRANGDGWGWGLAGLYYSDVERYREVAAALAASGSGFAAYPSFDGEEPGMFCGNGMWFPADEFHWILAESSLPEGYAEWRAGR